jgi:hypothetical protein
MPCEIKHFTLNEIDEGLPGTGSPTPSRIARLQRLLCAGPWGADNNLVLLYWNKDATKPGGSHWVGWEDPDPLPPAGITVA